MYEKRLKVSASVGGRRAAVVVAVACAAAALAAGSPAQATARVPPPGNTALSGVVAVSASDAWAVGAAGTSNPSELNSLTLHWNGKSWVKVTSPDPGGTTPTSSTELTAVSAVSASDAWAVGYYTDPAAPRKSLALVLRWNGTKWAQVASHAPASSHLSAVSAVSATDAWAVGDYADGKGQDQTLALHWNGTSWKQFPTPDPAGSGRAADLTGVSAVSAGPAWTVGTYTPSSGRGSSALVLRWNGTSWKLVTNPNPPGTGLSAVSARTGSDIWAAGYSYVPAKAGGGSVDSLVLHSDGTRWAKDTTPDPGTTSTTLNAVSAASASQAWAVGYYETGLPSPKSGSLALRWNGTKWAQVPSPNPGGTTPAAGGDELTGISALTSTDAWAVGAFFRAPGPNQTMILHWNGTSWKQVASPN